MLYLFGGALACVGKCRSYGAHITFHFVCTQGFISGFALIPPWAMRGYRPFRAHCRIVFCFPRVPYRASPSFHPGFCRSIALSGLFVGLAVCTQGFISGFALIPPWAMQECRPCRAHCRIGRVYPGFHIGLCPHFTLGFAGVPPFQGSLHAFAVFPGFHIGLRPHFTLGYAGVPPFQGSLSYWLCLPRVSYRALPSFHPGLCRSAALTGLVDVFINYLLLLMCLSDTGRDKSMG